jgi:hypothetical protein
MIYDPNKVEHIRNQLAFNLLVQRAVTGKTWTEVYLKKPRVKLVID